MENIKHIFFDLDDTLLDYRKNAVKALELLFAEYNIDDKFEHDFKSFHDHYYVINEMLWADVRDGKIDRAELQKRRFPEAFKNMGIDDVEFGLEFEDRFIDEVTKTDRKSTRLNSSHVAISYAVFCLKKKRKIED